MKMSYKGLTIELPEWCKTWPEDAVNDALESFYQQSLISAEEKEARWKSAIENDRAETAKKILEGPAIRNQLKEAGYTKQEIREILYRWKSGQTLDSAMQIVMGL